MKLRFLSPDWAKPAGLVAAFLFAATSAATFAPVPAQASAVNVVYGYVEHVSSTNIKIYAVDGKQTLSFELLPKFDQVFSDDGKTTYQMKNLKSGMFVKLYYDQKFLGMRHADRIFVYRTNGTTPSSRQ